jgi:cytochrome c-type biogenesis protein CcmE
MSARRGRGSTPRLVIALSIAAILAIFLLYTSIAGSATVSLTPRTLAGHTGEVTLAGVAKGPLQGDAHGSGLRFVLQEIGGTAAVPVVYHGSVPDLFGLGRHVVLQGRLRGGVFEATPDSLVTKCPSKYVAKKTKA